MAGKQTVREKAEALGAPVAQRLGLTLWDTEYVKEGASYFLRFYIDKSEGVTLDDCEAFSREIDPLLDEADFIDDAYYLEVSSPGIERKLSKPEHFEMCIGEALRLRLIRPIDGIKELTGTLSSYDNGVIILDTADGCKNVELKACAWVHLCDIAE